MSAPAVIWFRRDLRLADHPALAAAAAAGEVVGLFVDDPSLAAVSGRPRAAYLHDCLRSLDASMGNALVVRRGDPATVVAEVSAEVGADEIYVTRDHSPRGRRRDAEVADRLSAAGRRLVGIGTNYLVPPGRVLKGDGSSYAVFTPFFRTWMTLAVTEAPVADVDPSWVELRSDGLPERPDPGCELPDPGEAGARRRWHEFLADGLSAYDDRRDLPAVDGTSRLSAALKWGTVHPRTLLADIVDGPGLDQSGPRVFVSELAWRDFYADVLHRRPETAWSNLDPKMNAMAVDTDAAARQRFERWCEGRTGFPIIDAGMRQLLATGWMHNRVRMIVASFLVKDLHLPWQWGAAHFMRHLVDGDVASNNHGWQWAAGTGTDAAPYFRVFNPWSQQKRFDPDGAYVARWVPEVGTDAEIAPMVDHAAERAEALERYRRVTGR